MASGEIGDIPGRFSEDPEGVGTSAARPHPLRAEVNLPHGFPQPVACAALLKVAPDRPTPQNCDLGGRTGALVAVKGQEDRFLPAYPVILAKVPALASADHRTTGAVDSVSALLLVWRFPSRTIISPKGH